MWMLPPFLHFDQKSVVVDDDDDDDDDDNDKMNQLTSLTKSELCYTYGPLKISIL